MPICRENVPAVSYSMFRSRANDTERTAKRLDNLVSHLFRAIDLTLLTSQLNAGERQIGRLLASIGGAVILLDRQGRVLQMTPLAEELLRERDGLQAVKGSGLTLGAQRRLDSSRLATCIKHALAVARGKPQDLGEALQINRPSGRRALLVQVTPLPAPAFSPWNAIDTGARVMVQIVDPQAAVNAQAGQLQLVVGLTAAETRVAALLGSGLGLTEAAGVLAVSPNTVKTHARQVFAKAGVHSSAALARLIASIPVGPRHLGKSS